MAILDITTYAGPYPSGWGLLDDDAQTINDADTATLPQARITALKMYETAGAAGGVTDDDAIHDNVASEISAITEKVTPVSADLLIIEDSAAANVKKKVQVGNLPGGGGSAITEIADVTFSGQSSVDVNCTGYDQVQFIFEDVDLSAASNITMRVSTDGITFDSGATDYRMGRLNHNVSTSVDNVYLVVTDAIQTANYAVCVVYNLASSTHQTQSRSVHTSDSGTNVILNCHRKAAQVDTHIRVLTSSGTLDSGKLRVLGVG